MSELSSASNVDLSFREPPHLHQGDKQRDRSCRWTMTKEERDRSAPAKSPSHERSIDDFEVAEISRCVYKKTPCDLHYQADLDFCGECGDEPSQDCQTQPMSPGVGHKSASPSEEALSDREDSHGESYSSREYVDESEDDDLTDDLDDNVSHDNEDDEDNDLDDDGDGDNETPWSDEAANEEEFDMEETISRDHVSQRRMQRVEINKDCKKTPVPIAEDDKPVQSMINLLQCDVTANPSGTISQSTVERLISSPSTPEGMTSSLQRRFEDDSSRKVLFRGHFERSPSGRTLRAATTLSADPSCDEDVNFNEESVRQRIVESFAPGVDDPGPAREGFVYAFRDNELELTKIGFTVRSLKSRKSSIERKCGFVNGLTLVAAVKVNAYKQLEKIVHQDLAPHRVYFDCACGKFYNKKKFARHHEYFEIDNDTALGTLQLWGDFVDQRPWDRHLLKDEWCVKLSASSKVESSEMHTSHDERVKRWRNYFGILESSIDIIRGPSTSPLTARSTATERNTLAGTTKESLEDRTPSKPPRASVENMAEEDKPPITCPLLPGPLKRSPSSEPAGLAHVQDTHNTDRGLTCDLPYRAKDTGLTSDGGRSAEKRSFPIFASTVQAPPYNSDSPRRMFGNTTLAANNGQPNPDRVATPTAQESLADCGPFQHIRFSPIWRPPVDNSQIPTTKPDSNVDPTQSTEKMISAPERDAAKPFQHKAEPNPKTLLSQKQQEHTVTVLTSPLVQSAVELAKSLLAKEVRPLPARVISDDLWQLRWPLACSVAFALQSPHIPAGLSFFMWSVFLPFFVAELRGWTVVGDA